MIITRTPFRVSFAGGGTDMKEFYSRNGYGAVVSATINRYMYIVIHPYFHDKIRVKYSRTEDVDNVADIAHPIVRECLRKVGIERGVEIASFADIPAGTGLGSSCAFTVGLLHSLYAYKGKVVSKEQLAREACEIEIDILGEPIGKQDQYAVAYGGLNHIVFYRDEKVEVSPILLTEAARKNFESMLSLYYIGGERSAGDILSEQRQDIAAGNDIKFQNLRKMVALTEELQGAFQNNKLDSVGDILHRGWLYKKELSSSISNPQIDALYKKALTHGARGGKLLGAGGTGFLLIDYCDRNELGAHMGCRTLPFAMDREGTKILFYE